MSEPTGQFDGGLPWLIKPKPGPVPSVGEQLRVARERQGIDLAGMANKLKVSETRITALEDGRFDSLPNIVFTRSLACSMCRILNMDATAVLAQLPHQETPHINTDQARLNTAFRTGTPIFLRDLKVYLTQPLGLGVLLLVLGIAVVLWMPTPPRIVPAKPFQQGAAQGGSTVVTSPFASPVPLVDSQTLTTLSKSPTSPAQTSTTSTVTPTVIPDKGGSAVRQATLSVLWLEATKDSWVSVTDVTGRSSLRKMIRAGEAIPVSGALPLSVVVGRADVVTVTVRGQRLNILEYANKNVARFEVK